MPAMIYLRLKSADVDILTADVPAKDNVTFTAPVLVTVVVEVPDNPNVIPKELEEDREFTEVPNNFLITDNPPVAPTDTTEVPVSLWVSPLAATYSHPNLG